MNSKDFIAISLIVGALCIGLVFGDKIGYQRGYARGDRHWVGNWEPTPKALYDEIHKDDLPINTPNTYQKAPKQYSCSDCTDSKLCTTGGCK